MSYLCRLAALLKLCWGPLLVPGPLLENYCIYINNSKIAFVQTRCFDPLDTSVCACVCVCVAGVKLWLRVWVMPDGRWSMTQSEKKHFASLSHTSVTACDQISRLRASSWICLFVCVILMIVTRTSPLFTYLDNITVNHDPEKTKSLICVMTQTNPHYLTIRSLSIIIRN